MPAGIHPPGQTPPEKTPPGAVHAGKYEQQAGGTHLEYMHTKVLFWPSKVAKAGSTIIFTEHDEHQGTSSQKTSRRECIPYERHENGGMSIDDVHRMA